MTNQSITSVMITGYKHLPVEVAAGFSLNSISTIWSALGNGCKQQIMKQFAATQTGHRVQHTVMTDSNETQNNRSYQRVSVSPSSHQATGHHILTGSLSPKCHTLGYIIKCEMPNFRSSIIKTTKYSHVYRKIS